MRMLTVPEPWRAVHAAADRQVETMRRIIMRLWASPIPGLEEACATGRISPVLTCVNIAWVGPAARAERDLMRVYLTCLVDAGKATVKTGLKVIPAPLRTAEVRKRIELGMSFDETDPNALRWARQNAGALVTNLTSTQRDAVQHIVTSGFAKQFPPRQMAKQIKDVVGMTSTQTKKYERLLAEKGQKKATAYMNKARKDRALLIARTETMRASNEGQQEGWEQAKKEGLLTGQENRVWITTLDDRSCPICNAMDGQVVAMSNSAFAVPGSNSVSTPPAHPRCRCAMALTEAKITPVKQQTEDWKPPPRPSKTGTGVGDAGTSFPTRSRSSLPLSPDLDIPAVAPTSLSTAEAAIADAKRNHAVWSKQNEAWVNNRTRARTAGPDSMGILARQNQAMWQDAERKAWFTRHGVAEADRAVFDVAIDKSFSAAEQAYFREVIEDVSKLIHRDALAAGVEADVEFTLNIVLDTTGRAAADGIVLKLQRMETPSTIAHELLHSIEHQSRLNKGTIHQNTWKYFEQRVKVRGTGVKPMQELVPMRKYFEHEISDPDGFGDAYMGKIYKDAAGKTYNTELGSMAIEELVGGTRYGADREMLDVVLQSWRKGKVPTPADLPKFKPK